eukprot:632808_1
MHICKERLTSDNHNGSNIPIVCMHIFITGILQLRSCNDTASVPPKSRSFEKPMIFFDAMAQSWIYILYFVVLLLILNAHAEAQYYVGGSIEIGMYSRGKNQEQINDVDRSFVKINGSAVLSSGRGMGIVVLDENNATIIDSLSFDVHIYGEAYADDHMVEYLNDIKTNRIVCIVAYDEASGSDSVISILNTWGCTQVTDLSYREAFIFIGTKNTVNISNFTYCEKSPESGAAILKTFEIPIHSPNINDFPYQMIPLDDTFTCNPLTDSFEVVHHIDYDRCLAQCRYNDKCIMINYVLSSKTSSDSRCYMFDGQCTLSHDHSGNLVAVKGFNGICIDYPPDWIDTYTDDCQYYEKYNWCHDHSIANGINVSSFIEHSDFAYGFNAIQTCCVCGGGLHLFGDMKLEFTVSLNGMPAFDRMLCDWNLGYPNQYEHFNGYWSNIYLFDLCTQLMSNTPHHFVAVSDTTAPFNPIKNCEIFIDSSYETNDEIFLCDFDRYDFSGDITSYFIAIFDVDVNQSSVIYLNNHWFNTSQLFAFTDHIKRQTYKACVSSLSESTQSTLHAIHPCDILTPSPTSNPVTASPTTLRPTVHPSQCSYFNPGPITVKENNELTTFSIGQNIHVELDFVLNNGCSDTVCNLLHIGDTAHIRVPGIWIQDDGAWNVRFSNNAERDAGFDVSHPSLVTRDAATHHLLIVHSQSQRIFVLDAVEYYSDEGDFTNTDYQNNYPLYVSDPWYDSLDVIVANLCIITEATQPTQSVVDDEETTQPRDQLDMFDSDGVVILLAVSFCVLFMVCATFMVMYYKMNQKIEGQNRQNGGVDPSETFKMKQMATEMQALRSMINELKNAPTHVAGTDNHQCILCVDNVANMFNYPCGHVSYCMNCSLEALNQDNKCPNCRELVLECKNIYSGGFAPDRD